MAARKSSAVKSSAGKSKAGKSNASKSPAKKAGSKPDSPWAHVFAPRTKGEKRYWLVKSEPETFSFDDFLSAPGKTTCWDKVRNPAARNFMRDGMKIGDRVFFYHSMAEPPAIVGICEVVREGYADHTQFESGSDYFDPKATKASPVWYMVDLKASSKLEREVSLGELKANPKLADMALLRVSRLSVVPVSEAEWKEVCQMAVRAPR